MQIFMQKCVSLNNQAYQRNSLVCLWKLCVLITIITVYCENLRLLVFLSVCLFFSLSTTVCLFYSVTLLHTLSHSLFLYQAQLMLYVWNVSDFTTSCVILHLYPCQCGITNTPQDSHDFHIPQHTADILIYLICFYLILNWVVQKSLYIWSMKNFQLKTKTRTNLYEIQANILFF